MKIIEFAKAIYANRGKINIAQIINCCILLFRRYYARGKAVEYITYQDKCYSKRLTWNN